MTLVWAETGTPPAGVFWPRSDWRRSKRSTVDSARLQEGNGAGFNDLPWSPGQCQEKGIPPFLRWVKHGFPHALANQEIRQNARQRVFPAS